MIRRAVVADIPQIVELAVESVSRDPLPVKVMPAAMAETARSLIGNPAHFVWVGEHDGKVCACLAACVQPSFWFRGVQASVLLCWTRRAGAGIALLREFARWCKSRSAIKVAVFELEPGEDPRIAKLLRRLGFDRESRGMTYVRAAQVSQS